MRDDSKIILAIGSNTNQRQAIDFAKGKIQGIAHGMAIFSKEIWTEPIGMESEMFLNCLCSFRTIHKKEQLERALKRIEREFNRSRKNDRLCKITLDIDILQHGEQRFHEQDWEREYIHILIEDLYKQKE